MKFKCPKTAKMLLMNVNAYLGTDYNQVQDRGLVIDSLEGCSVLNVVKKVLKLEKLQKTSVQRYLKNNTSILDREHTLWTTVQAINTVIDSFNDKKYKKDNFKMIVCGGSTGIGKSTFLDALNDIYMQEQNYIPISISFSRDPHLYNEDADELLSMETLIVTRCRCALDSSVVLRDVSSAMSFFEVFKDPSKAIVLFFFGFSIDANIKSPREKRNTSYMVYIKTVK